LGDDVVQALYSFSPRDMPTATRSLFANTVLTKRWVPQLKDVPDIANRSATKIGFITAQTKITHRLDLLWPLWAGVHAVDEVSGMYDSVCLRFRS
jgi:hypothetical protein